MGSQVTLKQVLTLLKSDKSKDRQQGINSLKDAFGRREAIQKLDAEKKDGRAWLIVFQALFSTVLSERTAALKKGSLSSAAPATLRRLEDAAGAVRWLVERSVAEWNGKVCKPLIKHLMQCIVHQGKLLQPVALHYVKALRIICAYPPHLDHIQYDEAQCISILSLAFAAVLGDSLKSNLEDEEEGMSEDEVMDELSEDEESGSSRKRKRSPERGRSRATPKPRSVSLEQIEFVAIISIILRSPRTQLAHPDHPRLPRALLDRLCRFFKIYSSDTSAHLDMMSAVNSSLDALALNCKNAVADFGKEIWDSLLLLWSTKSRDLKESVLAALTTLLPHVAHPDVNFDLQDGVSRLLRLLHGENDARWGFESLSIDSVRLEIVSSDVREKKPFSARTFTHGFGFNASQVVAWTLMELQADCMKELYMLSESIHPGTPSVSRSEGKRAKLINPISSLLQSVQKHQSAASRSFYLQCLLFFIDRHWSLLHSELRIEVANTLLQVVAIDDPTSQSWVFACFAALSFAEGEAQSTSETSILDLSPSLQGNSGIPWDIIWSHAMRRTSSPAIGRAACHAAHALLICERLPSNRALTEIEAMIQDISVQGPTAPFDSVCAFLSECLKVASQDARLYRMHMEDKVLSWLSENMNSIGGQLGTAQTSSNAANVSRLEQYFVQDVLGLLQTACSLTQRSTLLCPLSLPDHFLVPLQKDRSNASIIRGFLLHASLTHDERPRTDPLHVDGPAGPASASETKPSNHSSHLVSPGIRERKASALLLKLVESVTRDWESRGTSRPTVESVRRVLDFAVLAIAFEGLLVMNGMTINRRSILVACKLVTTLVQCLIEMHWTYDEMALLCEAFLPLTNGDDEMTFDDTWEGVVDAGPASGISATISTAQPGSHVLHATRMSRKQLQGIIWQSADVQDALESCMKVFRRILNSVVSGRPLRPSNQLTSAGSMVADDEKDDFAPIRTAQTTGAVAVPGEVIRVDRRLQDVARICVDILTMIPILQSSEQRAPRDKSLAELFCDSIENETFSVLVEPFICHVFMRNIHIGSSVLDRLFGYVGDLLVTYKFGQSEPVQMMAILLLHATASVWLNTQSADEDIITKAQVFYRWAIDVVNKNQLRSWRTRNKMVHFLEFFLDMDPHETFLSNSDSKEFDVEEFPSRLLPLFNKDCDMRVRFTAACASARLFSTPYMLGKDPMIVYGYIRSQLCVVLADYEEMLTRMLCLGNVMVTSSSVRRGPLWHSLETCLFTPTYIPPVSSIFREVARKLGLKSVSPLFEAYASQIVFSLRRGNHDIFRLPPALLGYDSKKAFAEATFMSFSPTNLMQDENGDIEGGKVQFKKHCNIVGLSEEEGLRICFADVVGYHITSHFTFKPEKTHPSQDEVKMEEDSIDVVTREEVDEDDIILHLLENLCPGIDVPKLMKKCVDRIVLAIVRTLSDFDFAEGGLIVRALEEERELSDKVSRAFRSLMRFRSQSHFEFDVHDPNLPTCPTHLVIKSLKWLSDRIDTVKSAGAIYHVIQTLFTEVARCPVVNEQIRLMTSLCVYISMNYLFFKNVALLRVLLNGSASLLSNPILVGFAQGILDWTFIHLRDLNCEAPHLSAILIRVGCAARDFCRATNESIRLKGMQLKAWIEGQLKMLSDVSSLRFCVLSALAAWPEQLPAELEDLRANLTPTDLSAILDDPFLPSYNFKVVRQILEAVNGSSYSTEQFSKRDFWRLKDSVPSSALVDEEAVAFSKLLVYNRGRIESHTVDQQYKRSIGARHQRQVHKDEKGKNPIRSNVKLPIVMAFLDLLADEDPATMSVAYQTLRRIASTDPLDSKEFGSWSSEYRGDASLLSFCPTHRKEDMVANLRDIETDEFIALGRDFLQWIAKITKFLAGLLSSRDRFYSHLRLALETNVSFAEQMFPVLVHEVLRIDYEGRASSTRAGSYKTMLSKYFASLLTNEKTDPRCLLCLVNTVLHLRYFEPSQSPDLLIYNKWLDLDFVLLSRCAIACGAYTTGLLFLELATDGRADENAEIASEEILFDIYSHIEEPDGFYGIKSRDPRSFLLKRFRHERQWNKSFQFHGARFEAGEVYAGNNQGIVESLHSFGFNKLALSCLESSGFDGMASGNSSALTYRLGWRAESWDLPDLPTSDNSSSNLYSALKAVHREQDSSSVDKVVNTAIWKELQRLRDLASENLVEIRQVTQAVMCLAQIKEWRSDAFQSDISSRSIDITSGHWMAFCDIAPGFGFDDLESILATRISLLRSMRQREQRDQIGTLLSDMSQSLLALEIKCLVQLSEAARGEGEAQIALNSITQAQLLDQGELFEISDEFASVLWGQGEQRLAVELLKKELRLRAQVSSPMDIDDKVRHASILARLGEWTSEACLEKPESILESYFKPAIRMMDNTITPSTSQSSSEDRSAVYYKFALFAEQQYQVLLRSDEIARFKVYSERKRQEVTSRQESYEQASTPAKEAQKRQLDKAMKLLKQDTAYYQHATQSRDLFLVQAIEMLSHALCASDTFDGDASIRLCSLWLSNFKTTTLDKTINASLERVPSRKLVFLAHQLSARLTDSNDASVNQVALRTLVLRMGSEHPFHSLYQVYALQSSDGSSRRTSAAFSETFSQRERASAASNIFNRILSTPGPSSRVRNLQKLCEAYIEWANFPVKKNPNYTDPKKTYKVPAHMKLIKISNLPVPVTTAHTPLDPTLRYDDCVWIEGYSDQFNTAGGVNLPKISVCKGSDGKAYKQLFKSDDDLRQDAVMEQVFELCNQVLHRDRNSRKRNLSIRSYKVVPLAAQAGLLEFVGNTTPMKEWLLTAHKRYNQKDLGMYECQHMLSAAAKDGKKGKIKAMKDIRAHFHPVLRHFFTERHKLPLAWFEMRLNYTRSVATTSIIGHILGLGDRHISNILLDKVSGEVVHIDLGIAFDQGKLLPVPEIVPFRLTPDVVDGFGISGTEGVFRRCAEETLRVLREGSAVIKTVLEVFKYDPLHSWTANALRLQKAQGGSSMINLESERFGIGIDMESGSEDENADRALSGVVRKLDKSLSVEFTVNELISEATDDTNLAQMFPGWSPQC